MNERINLADPVYKWRWIPDLELYRDIINGHVIEVRTVPGHSVWVNGMRMNEFNYQARGLFRVLNRRRLKTAIPDLYIDFSEVEDEKED